MDTPCIFPTQRYRDPDAAMAWLAQTLGFKEHMVARGEGNIVEHAQMSLGASIIMLGQMRDDAYGRLLGDPDGRRTDGLYVAVEDVDALHAKVVESGTKIESAPHDTSYGSRDFSCRDPEGNLWCFGTYWPKVDDA